MTQSDNTALARFITSLGSLNNYGSTVYQTKQALDLKSTAPLRQHTDDIAIFTDALKGMQAIQKIGFNTDGIIAINQQFDTESDEQPNWPGHLRNAMYNEDDRVAIGVSSDGKERYFPPEIVTKNDLNKIINQYQHSRRHESDAWRVFAQISKLQPFQDGNKRTALIAANAANGSLDDGNYLILPINDLDRADFTLGLMRYYVADTTEQEEIALQRMLSLLPSTSEKKRLLNQPIIDDKNTTTNQKTIHYKPQFRDV
ncbi:Fic family protein [Secundilactobacillus muriivasis]